MEKSLPDFIQVPTLLLHDSDLQQLDWIVYGVIYWYAKFQFKKCTASNQSIAEIVRSSPGSVSNSLSRLRKKKYISIVSTGGNNRKEIVPLIYYRLPSTDGTNNASFHLQMERVPSVDVQSNNIYKKKKKDGIKLHHNFSSLSESPHYRPNDAVESQKKIQSDVDISSTTPKKAYSNSNLTQDTVIPLVYKELYEIAKRKNVSLLTVDRVHRQALDSIADGNKYKIKNLAMAVSKWIDRGLGMGHYQEMGMEEQIVFSLQSPEQVEKINQARSVLKEKGLL